MDFGLAENEFWRLTPRQFALYAKRYEEAQKRNIQLVRFLATATARALGHDVDYMEESEPEINLDDPVAREQRAATFAAYLEAKARTANGAQIESNHMRDADAVASADGAPRNGD